ncbi:1-acyl-sn-glycerol-3-phosphate acyltransferase [Mucilaginibacter terrenus]|nr:1-acyl-sn-glycerol-3-phosphate acyltransferase [Mucilaginibacter terrenus]
MKWIFRTYVNRLVKNEFHEITYNNVLIDPERSVLLIGNHFSFWDGLILFYLNEKLFKKKFHVMILEETARKSSMLRYGGAFTVNKTSKDVIASLNYAAELLKDPSKLVLMFPQGKLFSNFVEEVKFEKGVMRLIDKAGERCQVIFAATFIQYFRHKKPNVNVYLEAPVREYAGLDITKLQNDYQQLYKAGHEQQTKIEI